MPILENHFRLQANIEGQLYALARMLGRVLIAAFCLCPLGFHDIFASTQTGSTQSNSEQKRMPDAATLAAQAVQNDIKLLTHTGMYLRYKVHKVDDKGDTLRDIIETKDGTVARMIARDGRPLTDKENRAEIDRLNSMLAHPDEFAAHIRRENAEKSHAQNVLQTIPQGLIFEIASPQEPLPEGGTAGEKVVELTFKPNPNFQPPTIESQVLKAMAGKVWIDAQQQQIVHLEVHLISDAAFGWGLLGKVYRGGSIVLDQVDAGDHHWIMTRLRQKLTIRALMVKVIHFDVKEDISDFRIIKEAMSYQQGIRELLSTSAQ